MQVKRRLAYCRRELSNPFSLFSLFTLIPYFFSFPFFPALRRVDFFGKIGVNVKFYTKSGY
jgi:hypothetical protein